MSLLSLNLWQTKLGVILPAEMDDMGSLIQRRHRGQLWEFRAHDPAGRAYLQLQRLAGFKADTEWPERLQQSIRCGYRKDGRDYPNFFDKEQKEFYGWWYNPRDGKFYLPKQAEIETGAGPEVSENCSDDSKEQKTEMNDSGCESMRTANSAICYQSDGGRLNVSAPENETDHDWMLILLKEQTTAPVTQKNLCRRISAG